MKHLRKWTVCLNNTAKDEHVMKYVSVMARFYQPESIHLLHVIEREEVPDILLKEYSDLHEPELAHFYNILEEKSKEYLSGVAGVTTEVRKGAILREILECTYDNVSDLIFMGRGTGRGTIMKKVTRKSSASVMIVPENSSVKMNHVLVSTDFSEHSRRALQIGASLTLAFDIPKVSTIHVYNDASKYVRDSLETSFEVGQLLQKRAAVNKKLEKYLKLKMDEFVTEAAPDAKVGQMAVATPAGTKKSETLVQWVKDSDVDLVILGAKGQSSAEAFFLGSYAEDVYSRLNRQVILIFKKQGENRSFIQLLLGIMKNQN